MIAAVLNLTWWEWFKVRKRWMPWILLGIIVAIAQLVLWGSYVSYHNETIRSFLSSANFWSASTQTDDGIVSIELTCDDVAKGRVAEKVEALPKDFQEQLLNDIQEFSESCSGLTVLEEFREAFALPSSITSGIEATHMIGVILILILASSVAGTEYGWGTLRNVLTRGVGRWQLLASKLLLLLLMGAAGLIVVSVFSAVASLIAGAISPNEAVGLFDSGKWSDAAVMFGRAFYGLVPYIVLGAFLTVLTSSSSTGVSIAMGYYFVEMIATPFLLFISWLENVPDFLIGQNVNLWMAQAAVVSGEVTRDGVVVQPPGTLHAFLVMLAYIVVLSVATFWMFQRRDIAGEKGS